MAGKKCPKCEAAVGSTARFCKTCGIELDMGEDREEDFVAFGDAAIDALEDSVISEPKSIASVPSDTSLSKEAVMASSAALSSSASGAVPAPVSDSTPVPVPDRDEPVSLSPESAEPESVHSLYSLMVLNEDAPGKTVDVASGNRLLIGAAPGSAIQLSEDSYVSKQHAIVTCEDGLLRVQDDGSSNGTYVSIQVSPPLQNGQIILVGRTQIQVLRKR